MTPIQTELRYFLKYQVSRWLDFKSTQTVFFFLLRKKKKKDKIPTLIKFSFSSLSFNKGYLPKYSLKSLKTSSQKKILYAEFILNWPSRAKN